MRARAIVVLCLASLLWGSGWLFTPELAEVVQPFAAAALAMALAAALLGAVAVLAWARTRRPLGPALRAAPLLGVIMLGAPAALLLLAGAHGLGGIPLLLYALLPMLTGFAAERWPAAAILAPGTVFLLIDRTLSFSPRQIAWSVLVLAAVSLQAWALRYAAQVLHGTHWSERVAGMAVQAAVAAAVLGAGSLVLDASPRLAPFAQWNSNAWFALAYLAVAGAAVPYLLLYRLLARGVLRPDQVAAGQWLQTLCLVAESAYFVHARVPWPTCLGGAALLSCFVWMLHAGPGDAPLSIAPSGTPGENDLP